MLSPQQLTSCDTTSYGCGGGWTESAYSYVVTAGGITTAASYPYVSGTTEVSGTCTFNSSSQPLLPITGYVEVAEGEPSLMATLNNGPPSICLAATVFQTYVSGVITTCDTDVNHCIQAAGYGTDPTTGLPYWLLRNQWGTYWGENGYVRIARGSNLCLLSNDINYPTFT